MDFALPEIGEGVYEAELVRWLVKAGRCRSSRGQNLVEVMTDKATMEVPSPFVGHHHGVARASAGSRDQGGTGHLSNIPASGREPSLPRAAKPTAVVPAGRCAFRRDQQWPRPCFGSRPAAGQGSAVGAAHGPQARHRPRRPYSGSGPEGRVLVEDRQLSSCGMRPVGPEHARGADRPWRPGLRQTWHAHQAAQDCAEPSLSTWSTRSRPSRITAMSRSAT